MEELSNNFFLPDLSNEFIFTASKSSGPGGQSVNKTSSKAELWFNIQQSEILSHEQKLLLNYKLAGKINAEGYIRIVSQTERSLLKNKNNCIEKFYALISKCLTKRKTRKASVPTAASMEKRIKEKKMLSKKKSERRIKTKDIS